MRPAAARRREKVAAPVVGRVRPEDLLVGLVDELGRDERLGRLAPEVGVLYALPDDDDADTSVALVPMISASAPF